MDPTIRDLKQTVASQERELASVQKQVTHLTAQREELDSSVASLKRELQDKGDRIVRYVEEQAGIKAELAAAKQEATRAGNRLDDLQKEKTDLLEKLREKTVAEAVTNLKMSKLQSDVDMLEDKVKAQAKELQEKEGLLSSATNDMLEMQKKLTLLDCEHRSMVAQVSRSQIAAQEAESHLQRIMKERMELSMQLSMHDEVKQKAGQQQDKERAEIHKELEKHEETIKQRDETIASLNTLLSGLKNELQAAKDTVQQKESTLKAAVEEAEELRTRLYATTLKETESSQSVEELETAKSTLEAELSELRKSNTAHALEIKDYMEKYNTAATALFSSTEELERVRLEHQPLVTAHEELQQQLQAREVELSDANGQLSQLKDNLEAKLEKAQAELKQQEASTVELLESKDAEEKALKARIESLESEKEAAQEREASLKKDLAEIKTDHELVDAKYQSLKGKMQKALDKIDDLRCQRDNISDKLESLQATNSRVASELNTKQANILFESPEWKSVIESIHERVAAYTARPDSPDPSIGGSLMRMFSGVGGTKQELKRADGIGSRSFRTLRDKSSSFSVADTVAPRASRNDHRVDSAQSLSGGGGVNPSAELLEELAALNLRNKVLESTLEKMQNMMIVSPGGVGL